MPQPMVIWDPAMMRYDFGANHPFHPLRWELTWRLAEALGVTDGVRFTSPEPAGETLLERVHTAEYIQAVKRGGAAEILGSLGHGLGTADNPTFPGMHEAAALIAGGSVRAARAIAGGEVQRAVHIAGGLHHAMRESASGFCIYNDAALAIDTLLDAGVGKVAYVDVDVHHGDGVQRAFYDDPRVLTISLHETPLSLWPGTGFVTEFGRGAAAGSAVNLPLPAGTGDAAWLRAFHAVVPSIVTAFAPDVLVTQHGADSHGSDPLADLNLTVDGQLASYIALRELAGVAAEGRWLALGGGGYAVASVVPRIWTHLVALVLDRDVDPATEIPPEWADMARSARPLEEMPTSMSDLGGEPIEVRRWDGHEDTPVDRVITQARREVFPLYGLDPDDPRD